MSEKSERDKWICTKCEWEGHVDDIDKHEQFSATQEEPAEWLWYCPMCKHTSGLEEKYENCAWCTTCEDEIVQDEGEQCWECQVSHAEMLADAARGH